MQTPHHRRHVSSRSISGVTVQRPRRRKWQLLCDHQEMEQEQAQVLSRSGNWAVVQLPGRALPGIHVQGDAFATLRTQLARAARALHEGPSNVEALDELDHTVEEIGAMLGFYEQVLSQRGIRRPY